MDWRLSREAVPRDVVDGPIVLSRASVRAHSDCVPAVADRPPSEPRPATSPGRSEPSPDRRRCWLHRPLLTPVRLKKAQLRFEVGRNGVGVKRNETGRRPAVETERMYRPSRVPTASEPRIVRSDRVPASEPLLTHLYWRERSSTSGPFMQPSAFAPGPSNLAIPVVRRRGQAPPCLPRSRRHGPPVRTGERTDRGRTHHPAAPYR